MDNLFSEDPQFRRVQYKKLSDNVREWQQEIAAIVAEKLPTNMGLTVEVVFQTVDDEKGYATGSAIAKDSSNSRQVGIPVIVKSWHLAPIDLFFREGKLHFLTDDNLAKVFFHNSAGTGIAPRAKPPMMADDSFAEMRNPPLGGKYSYSSPISAIELIGGTIGAEDIQILKEALAKNPDVLSGFHRRKTVSVLEKYAEEAPKPSEQDRLNKERTLGVFTVKKDSPNEYRLYSSNDQVFDPVMVSTDRQGLKNFLDMRKAELWDYESDPLSSIDQCGHFTVKPPRSPYGEEVDGPAGDAALGKHRSPWVFDPLQDDRLVKTIEKFGRYGVRDSDGVLAKGWVLPNVVDFNGSSRPIKLFLGKALASMQGRIAGIPLNDDADVSLKADSPDTGKTGVLVYRDGERILSTVPFQVTAVTVYKNLRSLSVTDYKGTPANLILSPNVNGIVKLTDNKNSELGPLLGPGANYIVSAKMFFVRMPRLCAVSQNPEDFKKIALSEFDLNPVKIAMANGQYVFRGGQVGKYSGAARQGMAEAAHSVKTASFDYQSLPRYQAEFLLASWGLPMDKTAEVLDGVKSRIGLEVHHLNFPPVSGEEKTASGKIELRKYAHSLRAPIGDLLKLAASIDDAQAVDSILSLGFINDENINRFASASSMLWETSNMLAKLLLASRLGMNDIPEEACRSALSHLQKVIDGLRRLKMKGEQETKTASPMSFQNNVGGRLMSSTATFGFVR